MSYCRWSTDDFQCDLYCYEDCGGGFTTHVAGMRYGFKSELPPVVVFDKEHVEEWLERDKKVQEMIKNADRITINLPHSGETFNDPDLASFRERIRGLKLVGYRVPENLIAIISEEIKGENP